MPREVGLFSLLEQLQACTQVDWILDLFSQQMGFLCRCGIMSGNLLLATRMVISLCSIGMLATTVLNTRLTIMAWYVAHWIYQDNSFTRIIIWLIPMETGMSKTLARQKLMIGGII
jgi:hypothetical protein